MSLTREMIPGTCIFPLFRTVSDRRLVLKETSVGREMVSDHYSLALAKSVLQFGAFIGTMHI